MVRVENLYLDLLLLLNENEDISLLMMMMKKREIVNGFELVKMRRMMVMMKVWLSFDCLHLRHWKK